MTKDEFEPELRKTEKRITKTYKLGTDFPEFDVYDLNGNRLTRTGLKGKVMVDWRDLPDVFSSTGRLDEMPRPDYSLKYLATVFIRNINNFSWVSAFIGFAIV